MFSKDITENDAFLDMPLSTQALYFHLGMAADDDGFVTPSRVMRMIGAQQDDLKLLVAKKFLLQYEDGVVVIKHWKINNYLRIDRYKETPHKEKKEKLAIKTNGSYTWYTTGIPDDIPVVDAGKVRLGKVITEQSSENDMPFNKYSEDYEEGVVDLETGKLHDPVAEQKDKDRELAAKFRKSVDWLVEHQGRDPKRTSIPKQLKAIKKLYEMGVSGKEAMKIIKECEESDIWRGKPEKPDFWTAVAIIQKRG